MPKARPAFPEHESELGTVQHIAVACSMPEDLTVVGNANAAATGSIADQRSRTLLVSYSTHSARVLLLDLGSTLALCCHGLMNLRNLLSVPFSVLSVITQRFNPLPAVLKNSTRSASIMTIEQGKMNGESS